MSEKKKPPVSQDGGVTVWGMMRDVLIASMNKGQFPIACVVLLLVVLILKMPADEVSRLVFLLVERLEHGAFVTNILLFASLGGWFVHARHQRQLFSVELERVTMERTTLQTLTIGDKVKSSRGE